MIPALDCSLSVTNQEVTIHHSLLAASLSGTADSRVKIARITDTSVTEPTPVQPGALRLTLGGTDDGGDKSETVTIRFAPHQEDQARHAAEAITKARHNELPDPAEPDAGEPLMPGCTGLALAAEFARDNSGELHAVEAAVMSDGHVGQPIAIDSAQALAQAIPESGILVAHNAQLVINELLRAGLISSPQAFACTLALSRAVVPDAPQHGLPRLAEELEVTGSPAQQVAGVFIALARRVQATGSPQDIFADQGLDLGHVDPEKHTVYPVLVHAEDPTTASEKKRPSPAPWSAVATPDTVPKPNPDADPDGLLYDQTVVLTGDFSPFDKGRLWSGMAERGATVAKNVTKKTTVLVIGEWKSTTSKEKRARELIEKGQDIQLWSAAELYTALGLDEEPPF